ncbi:hypothetical protein CHLRE_02g094750v5 [Chlamydomonas reinhardtii]|uniref:Uncharacterized protein n=1 Tax=Chlamydomonas reinhardtii TaxID=3055 RepID=A0A2K3E1H3_CHLRE|nr:uncharacterized protein CHLRE_02g094750v5 [Chlamydomonas reinhardtii]XP_042927129.1 uncharacterized protein CHLRE_02g094750v5 [Chlamydomonas reinhardtii]PNW86637.1 hypothetical protein CHLRE_02g094750v5 [Chlamydomonas reinhardtii]PNW86638.1 hypothetical protein CHLRE_02g094750v5 [Chlamydomonas reinhardtii]
MAKRSAPSLAEEQDMGAPAKAPRLDHPQQAASAGPAAAGASQALTARKPVNEMQREYRHLHGTGAPCKVTILHVTKYLGQVVAKTRPMVWQTNSAASSPAVRELQPGDGVILSRCKGGKETNEEYKVHIAPKLPAAMHTLPLDNTGVCFAVAAVKEVHKSTADAGGSAASETGTWVELEEASLVWINMPWKQLAEDFGLPDKSTTINRTEKQANIADKVRHYAQQVTGLLSRAEARGGAAASGRRPTGHLQPCPTGHFLRKLNDSAVTDDEAGIDAGGKQGYDSSDDGERGHAQEPGAASNAGNGAAGMRRGAAAAATAAALAPPPAPPAGAVTAGGAAAGACAGPSNAAASPLTPPPPQQPALAAEEEEALHLMRCMDVCLQHKDKDNKALAEAAATAEQKAAAAAAEAKRRITAVSAGYEEKLRAAKADFEQQYKALKEKSALALVEAKQKAVRALTTAQRERDEALAAQAAAMQERDTVRVQLQEAERARVEAEQQCKAAVVAAEEAEAAKANAQVESEKYKTLCNTFRDFLEKRTARQ